MVGGQMSPPQRFAWPSAARPRRSQAPPHHRQPSQRPPSAAPAPSNALLPSIASVATRPPFPVATASAARSSAAHSVRRQRRLPTPPYPCPVPYPRTLRRQSLLALRLCFAREYAVPRPTSPLSSPSDIAKGQVAGRFGEMGKGARGEGRAARGWAVRFPPPRGFCVRPPQPIRTLARTTTL
ncbi:hypothetical protein FB107DRAFT_267776, partial [Schizophyllum commune]